MHERSLNTTTKRKSRPFYIVHGTILYGTNNLHKDPKSKRIAKSIVNVNLSIKRRYPSQILL